MSWLQNPPPTSETVEQLIRLKTDGGDCDDNGSAGIKGWFDHYPLDAYQVDDLTEALAAAYPCEASEWWNDREAGIR